MECLAPGAGRGFAADWMAWFAHTPQLALVLGFSGPTLGLSPASAEPSLK